MEFVNKIKTLGFGYIFERAFERIVPAWIFRFCSLMVYQLDTDKLSDVSPSTATLRVCDNAQELEQLKGITGASGDTKDTIGFIATLDEEVAGGLLIALGDYWDHDLGLSFLIGKNGAWIHSARVDEAYRRQGIYSHLMTEAAQSRKDAGHAAPLIGVSKLNRGSRKAIQRFGTPVGQALVIRLGSMVWARTKGGLKQSQNLTLQCTRRPLQIEVSRPVETTENRRPKS